MSLLLRLAAPARRRYREARATRVDAVDTLIWALLLIIALVPGAVLLAPALGGAS